MKSLSDKGISDIIKVGRQLVLRQGRVRVNVDKALSGCQEGLGICTAEAPPPLGPSPALGSVQTRPCWPSWGAAGEGRMPPTTMVTFSIGAGASRRPEHTPAECPHQHAHE